jgi:hypothetical protein
MMRSNSGIIGPKQSTSTTAASGLFDTYDQYNSKFSDKWPQFQVESVSNSNGTSLNEETNNTITVTTSGMPNGTTLYYSITTVSGTTVVSSDFSSGSVSGSFTITNNSGSFIIRPVGDDLSESNIVKIEIRRGSISGDILSETGNLTIADAATSIGQDITSSFYEISNRFIDSGAYMGNNSDYNGPYDVGEVRTNFSGTGRIYIGVKVTASTVYYNDIPIAGVQVLSGTTLVSSWIFNTTSAGLAGGWETYNSQISGTSSQGFPVTPATASGYNYYYMNTTSTGRFSIVSSTGSPYTGAAYGISNTYQTTAAPVGDGTVPSSNPLGTYYAFRETSGSARYSGTVMRSPTYTFSGGEYIRVIHALTGYANSAMDATDSLYVAVY